MVDKNKLGLDQMIDIAKKADWSHENGHYREGTYSGKIMDNKDEISIRLIDFDANDTYKKGSLLNDLASSAVYSVLQPHHALGYFFCAFDNAKERFLDNFTTTYSIRVEYSDGDKKSYRKEELGSYMGRSKRLESLVEDVKDIVDRKENKEKYDKNDRGMKYADDIIRKHK